MGSEYIIQDTRIPVGMERFANAGRTVTSNIVFEENLVMSWRRRVGE